MLRSVLTILFISIFLNSFSQAFEGRINFVKKSLTDTVYYSYLVKNDMMRVDELNNNKNVVQSLLINLKEKTMTAISPVRKMYMPFPVSPVKQQNSTNFEVNETSETKQFFGYKCKKWTISNKKDSVLIDYWVARGNFNFFVNFLKISNTKDKSASYFLQFPENSGVFPMLSIEKDFTGKEELRLEVIKIKKEELAPEIFTIPADYVSFQR
ncbi:MAG: DUF4412 domain-containing protein [Chlorobi bacterium]|nr:DUF4412 domain-containing protein [Chlorobiota bacterium]